MADEQVLGSSEFVKTLRRGLAAQEQAARKPALIETVLQQVCTAVAGQSGRRLAPLLGVSPQAVCAAAQRSRRGQAQWRRAWEKLT
jgi:hypothetical protein